MLPRAIGGKTNLDLYANAPEPLLTATPMNASAGYISLPPGNYSFGVFHSGEHEHPLKTLPVLLRDKVFITILASQVNGQPTAELIDDTFDHEKTIDGRVTIRVFAPDATIVASAGGQKTVPIRYGESQVLDHLPARLVSVDLQAVLRGTEKSNRIIEADFAPATRPSLRYTVLAITDVYGRFSTILADDGQAPPPVPPAASPSKPPRR